MAEDVWSGGSDGKRWREPWKIIAERPRVKGREEKNLARECFAVAERRGEVGSLARTNKPNEIKKMKIRWLEVLKRSGFPPYRV